MQEKLTIARPYALAAFDYAREAGEVTAWSEMLAKLRIVVEKADLRALISHPRVTREQLGNIIFDVLEATLDDKRRNFVQILLDAERLVLAPEIAELFERYKASAEGVTDVEVISAYDMDAAQQTKIASALRERIGQDVELICTVDQTLIGGAVIRIGDSVIDVSLRGRLKALQQQLA
jgi:F-type H+-transporting ATPase subunit delta